MVSQVFPAGGFREGADAGVRRSYGRPLGGNSYTPELKQAAMLALGTERQIKFICTDEVASMPAAEGQPQKASSRAKTPQTADSPAAPAKNSAHRPPGHA